VTALVAGKLLGVSLSRDFKAIELAALKKERKRNERAGRATKMEIVDS